jgi:hypothetical protein
MAHPVYPLPTVASNQEVEEVINSFLGCLQSFQTVRKDFRIVFSEIYDFPENSFRPARLPKKMTPAACGLRPRAIGEAIINQ